MTTVTVVTERKVRLKAMMGKVTMSLMQESFKQSSRNHVIIVKIGIRPQLKRRSEGHTSREGQKITFVAVIDGF